MHHHHTINQPYPAVLRAASPVSSSPLIFWLSALVIPQFRSSFAEQSKSKASVVGQEKDGQKTPTYFFYVVKITQFCCCLTLFIYLRLHIEIFVWFSLSPTQEGSHTAAIGESKRVCPPIRVIVLCAVECTFTLASRLFEERIGNRKIVFLNYTFPWIVPLGAPHHCECNCFRNPHSICRADRLKTFELLQRIVGWPFIVKHFGLYTSHDSTLKWASFCKYYKNKIQTILIFG